ncbi:asparagine synthase (glutamine-hydrolyzing) [Nevskia soli]|uniref:asparagine synthase (glutamine-hydrolyzing) n=1 Tax=Nevskia soli TaxID=418856 RepID=UPI00068F3E74|nr:asparagine synthase (glutamine-hydrolyzing) [Nevskia soli]
MCGIAGFTTPPGLHKEVQAQRYELRLRRMTASLFHRGPDAQRALLLDGIALGHTRLAIVDLTAGTQPMSDTESGVTVVFNGEIFNHDDLRRQLASGYRFRTRCDTEVILAAYLKEGIDCVRSFNGQFAFALWDPRDSSLWLARDRVGICPLFYSVTREGLAFASEAKAIFAAEWLRPQLDPLALVECLQQWSPVVPRSSFSNVMSLPPGTFGRWHKGMLSVHRYWDLELGEDRIEQGVTEARAEAQLEELLTDAVRIRLQADVPVAAYLSGGVDSSLICAMAQTELKGALQTYSVNFQQSRYDEEAFQSQVALMLGTRHRAACITSRDIGELIPTVVRQAEQVLLRTAPAPFLKLSALVREDHTKVVLSGEGADELFWGYDLFKETAIRQFWARQPQSDTRPRLLSRLHPYLGLDEQAPAMLRQFYGTRLESIDAADSSHHIRWASCARATRFFCSAFLESVRDHDPAAALAATLPAALQGWKPLARAQYLEMRTLLSGYLLSSQGDRMLMANSIEGRFPFLDHRLIEFAARMPAWIKLRGLREKFILKRLARRMLPMQIVQRIKFPYRAPVAEALAGPSAPSWVREMLGREAVDAGGVFDAAKVGRLLDKMTKQTAIPSEADNMALMAVASTQLLLREFPANGAQMHDQGAEIVLQSSQRAMAA